MVDTVLFRDTLRPTVNVTTGAAPVELTPGNYLVLITSGGTAGPEVVNLPNLPIPSAWEIGSTMTLFFETQTDPGDSIHITINGSQRVNQDGAQLPSFGSASYVDIRMISAAQSVAFKWMGQQWGIMPDSSFTGEADQGNPGAGSLKGGDAAVIGVDHLPAAYAAVSGGWGSDAFANMYAGGAVYIGGGAGKVTGKGGNTELYGGDAEQGDGGDILLSPGNSTQGGDKGLVLISYLPTADPAVAGALWNDAGALKISAG